LHYYQHQAEAEERLGLPITFVQSTDEVEMMRGQLFFLSKIVAPLWEPVAALFPEVAHLADNLDRNQAYYEKEISAHAAAQAAAAAAAAAASTDAADATAAVTEPAAAPAVEAAASAVTPTSVTGGASSPSGSPRNRLRIIVDI
jgi:3'5'-cyclic nucleotide phosphodiesterase